MSFRTYIGFKDEHHAQIEKVCADTSAKDPTFAWAIKRSWFGQYDWILILHSRGKRQAHARGLLLVRKYLDDLGLVYWVKEKGATRAPKGKGSPEEGAEDEAWSSGAN